MILVYYNVSDKYTFACELVILIYYHNFAQLNIVLD